MAKRKQRREHWIVPRVAADGTTRYQARWHEGDRTRSKTFDTQDEAVRHLDEVAYRMRQGTYRPTPDATVGDLVGAYLERGPVTRDWAANTAANYRMVYDNQIKDRLGSVRADRLTSTLVQSWIASLAATGASAALIRKARTILSAAFDEAVQLDIIERNPVRGTRAPVVKRPKVQTWTIEECGRALEAATAWPTLHAFYVLALLTGMRQGEIRALKWGDISLEWDRRDELRPIPPHIHVQRSMTRDKDFRVMVGESTKTDGSDRYVFVDDTVVAELRSVQQAQRLRRIAHSSWQDTDLVLDRGNGWFLARQSIQNWHEKACAAASVPRVRLHDLRHTAASLMFAGGVHDKVIRDIVGHESSQTTLDIYTHVEARARLAAVEQLSERIRQHGS